MPQVAQVRLLEERAGRNLYLLELHSQSEWETAASNVASCVINAGGRLYQLESESRDLESVFREVNAHDS